MNTKAETAVPALSSIGIDIGKDVFHLVGFDAKGKIILRKKIKRLALADTFKKILPCIVGMEACLSAHFVSRTFGQRPSAVPCSQGDGGNTSNCRSAPRIIDLR